jgi:hypothetical protein
VKEPIFKDTLVGTCFVPVSVFIQRPEVDLWVPLEKKAKELDQVRGGVIGRSQPFLTSHSCSAERSISRAAAKFPEEARATCALAAARAIRTAGSSSLHRISGPRHQRGSRTRARIRTRIHR